MQNSILVVTPQATFGELIRQSLEEAGRYRVEVVYRGGDALQRCRRPEAYRLVILDGDLPGEDFGRLVADVRAAQPGARIAAIPNAAFGELALPELKASGVDGTLDKPFYLPHLPATIERLITGSSSEPPVSEITPGQPDWLARAPQSADDLEQLASACGAIGALLLRSGEARAGAGCCAAGAWTDALAEALGNIPSQSPGAETVLYRADPDGQGRVMVYALRNEPAWQLALVFPEPVTYSQARARFWAAARRGAGETGGR